MATVEDLPKARVTGQFLFVNQDNADPGTSPNAILVTGYVRFTCSVTPPLVYREKKVHAVPLVSDAVFNSQGHLIPLVESNPQNEVVPGQIEIGLELLADSPQVNPRGFTWMVSFNLKEAATGRTISIPPYPIYLSDGDDIDLADVMAVGASGGEFIMRGESAYEVAVLEGFKGSRPEWLESLKVKGDQGDSIKGDTGATPNISIGTVTTTPNPADGSWVASLIKGSADVSAALRESFPSTMKGDKGDTGVGFTPVKLTSTMDLDTLFTPGTYYQNLGGWATLENHYPIAGACISLIVTPWGTGTGEVVQQAITYPNSASTFIFGIFTRVRRGAVWTPWKHNPTQRVDTTAGRAVYTWDEINGREQLIHGDTGWREVPLSNGYVGYALFRRVGYTVYARLIFAKPPEATALNGEFLSATPTGFVSDSGAWIYFPARGAGSGATFYIYRKGSAWSVESAPTSGDPGQVRSEIVYTTNQPWPTTLPGTAVTGSGGIIPNT